MDNWGGITGYGSASLMPDDSGPSPNRIWKFIPTYKIKAALSNFLYLENVNDLLLSHKKVVLIGKQTVVVD